MERKTYQNKAKPYKMVPSKRINQKQRKKNDFDYIFLMIIFYNHIYFIICNNYFIISSPLAPIFISIISSWSYIIILELLLSILVLDFISLLFRQFHPNHLFLAFPSLWCLFICIPCPRSHLSLGNLSSATLLRTLLIYLSMRVFKWVHGLFDWHHLLPFWERPISS